MRGMFRQSEGIHACQINQSLMRKLWLLTPLRFLTLEVEGRQGNP